MDGLSPQQPSSIVAQKCCAVCNEMKPLEAFPVRKSAKDGHRNQCTVCRNAQSRAWRDANKDHSLAYHRAYYQANREKICAQTYASYETQRGKREQYLREWRARNHDRKVQYRRNYRARRKGAGASHTAAEWQAIKQAYDFTCLRCRRREPAINLAPDHVIPVSRGGSNGIDNIQPLCHDCNTWKNARTIDYRIPGSEEAERLALLLGPAARWSPQARAALAYKKRLIWSARGITPNANSTSGVRGVTYISSARYKKKWRACLMIDGKKHYLGHFATQEAAAQAVSAYLEAHSIR